MTQVLKEKIDAFYRDNKSLYILITFLIIIVQFVIDFHSPNQPSGIDVNNYLFLFINGGMLASVGEELFFRFCLPYFLLYIICWIYAILTHRKRNEEILHLTKQIFLKGAEVLPSAFIFIIWLISGVFWVLLHVPDYGIWKIPSTILVAFILIILFMRFGVIGSIYFHFVNNSLILIRYILYKENIISDIGTLYDVYFLLYFLALFFGIFYLPKIIVRFTANTKPIVLFGSIICLISFILVILDTLFLNLYIVKSFPGLLFIYISIIFLSLMYLHSNSSKRHLDYSIIPSK